MVGARHRCGNGGVGGCDHGVGARSGLDGQAVPHRLGREDRVGHLADGPHRAGQRGEKGARGRLGGGGGSGRLGSARGGGEAAVLLAKPPGPNEQGEHKRNDNGDEHAGGKDAPEAEHDREDAGQAADADGEGLDAEARADHCRQGRANHAADQRELVLEVDAEERRLGDAEVAGDARGDVDLLRPLVPALEHGHGEHGGALGDVGERDHGPEGRVAELVDELGVDGVGHVVQAGHDERRVDGTEERGEQHADVGGEAPVHHVGDRVANGPADGPHDQVRDEHGGHERHERHHDHAHDLGRPLGEELLEPHEHEGGHERGDDLALVAGAEEGVEAEVIGVRGNVLGGCGRHGEAVEQLRRHERQAEDDAQDLGGAHLARDRPADAHGKHVEDGLADDPQEVVHSVPERPHVRDGAGAVLEVEGAGIVEEVDLSDDVAEAENQAAADEGGNDRRKDLPEDAHGAPERVLVGACGASTARR